MKIVKFYCNLLIFGDFTDIFSNFATKFQILIRSLIVKAKIVMRNIPIVTKNLLIVNVVAFLACLVMGKNGTDGYVLNDILGLHFFMASDFHIYQLFTYMFMHGGFEHILFNMFALWMFGCVVERVWGPKKFLFIT